MKRLEFLKRTLAAPIAAVVGVAMVAKQKWEHKECKASFVVDSDALDGITPEELERGMPGVTITKL